MLRKLNLQSRNENYSWLITFSLTMKTKLSVRMKGTPNNQYYTSLYPQVLLLIAIEQKYQLQQVLYCF